MGTTIRISKIITFRQDTSYGRITRHVGYEFTDTGSLLFGARGKTFYNTDTFGSDYILEITKEVWSTSAFIAVPSFVISKKYGLSPILPPHFAIDNNIVYPINDNLWSEICEWFQKRNSSPSFIQKEIDPCIRVYCMNDNSVSFPLPVKGYIKAYKELYRIDNKK
jgi:hypothetical protein